MNPWFTARQIERETIVETKKFVRKPFTVDGVQVSEANMHEVAKWCDGQVRETRVKQDSQPIGALHIHVLVQRPLNPRQTMAFVGDWVLQAGSGYKVYTNKAFKAAFDPSPDEDFEKVYRGEPGDEELAVFQESITGANALIQ